MRVLYRIFFFFNYIICVYFSAKYIEICFTRVKEWEIVKITRHPPHDRLKACIGVQRAPLSRFAPPRRRAPRLPPSPSCSWRVPPRYRQVSYTSFNICQHLHVSDKAHVMKESRFVIVLEIARYLSRWSPFEALALELVIEFQNDLIKPYHLPTWWILNTSNSLQNKFQREMYPPERSGSNVPRRLTTCSSSIIPLWEKVSSRHSYTTIVRGKQQIAGRRDLPFSPSSTWNLKGALPKIFYGRRFEISNVLKKVK